MSNLSFDREKKCQIVLENFNNPTHEISLAKLQEISNNLKTPFHTFSSLISSCGDTVNLLIQKKNSLIGLACFASERKACCLTVAAANILCQWIENKNIELVEKEIIQIEKMLKAQVYQLNNCSQMEAFQDLPNFPQRIECVNLVLRGIKEILYG